MIDDDEIPVQITKRQRAVLDAYRVSPDGIHRRLNLHDGAVHSAIRRLRQLGLIQTEAPLKRSEPPPADGAPFYAGERTRELGILAVRRTIVCRGAISTTGPQRVAISLPHIPSLYCEAPDA